MNSTQILLLCLCGAVFLVIAVIAAIGNLYSLKGIPNKPVGNGQHGTARFATNGEVAKTYKHIPYTPKLCGCFNFFSRCSIIVFVFAPCFKIQYKKCACICKSRTGSDSCHA